MSSSGDALRCSDSVRNGLSGRWKGNVKREACATGLGQAERLSNVERAILRNRDERAGWRALGTFPVRDPEIIRELL